MLNSPRLKAWISKTYQAVKKQGVNSIDENKLKLIFSSSSLKGWEIKSILNNQEAVNGLNSINENKLKLIISSSNLKEG
ncbi:MAG: hypothetical protein PG981_000164 [Wolbachia endosymbiont of Ctenocephalides orientis wCori]|nr:MAG: hypothetical protein PG981_000164 [Wolbachia endosymbiont of Ctenocephalides orientis wCori]